MEYRRLRRGLADEEQVFMMTKRRFVGEGSRRKDFDEEWCFTTSEMEKKVSCKHDMIIEDKWKDLLEWELHQKSKYRTSSRKNTDVSSFGGVGDLDHWGVGGHHLFQPSRKGPSKNAAKNVAKKSTKNEKKTKDDGNIVWPIFWPHLGKHVGVCSLRCFDRILCFSHGFGPHFWRA